MKSSTLTTDQTSLSIGTTVKVNFDFFVVLSLLALPKTYTASFHDSSCRLKPQSESYPVQDTPFSAPYFKGITIVLPQLTAASCFLHLQNLYMVLLSIVKVVYSKYKKQYLFYWYIWTSLFFQPLVRASKCLHSRQRRYTHNT